MNSKVQARPLEDDIGTTRFTVQRYAIYRQRLQSIHTCHSSDVLADMRVNITEEGSERVIWYKASSPSSVHKADINSAGCVKERFLADDEIVEHFVVCEQIRVPVHS